MAESNIISSPGEFYSFMEGSIYKDFVQELDIRIQMLTNQLNDDELRYSGREYDLFRGGIKNMQQMKDIFSDLAQAKESDMREGENKNED